jgi:hypothetical protein
MLTLFNVKGSPVFSMILPSGKEVYSNSMDLTRFAKGVYYMKVFSGKEKVMQKIILY